MLSLDDLRKEMTPLELAHMEFELDGNSDEEELYLRGFDACRRNKFRDIALHAHKQLPDHITTLSARFARRFGVRHGPSISLEGLTLEQKQAKMDQAKKECDKLQEEDRKDFQEFCRQRNIQLPQQGPTISLEGMTVEQKRAKIKEVVEAERKRLEEEENRVRFI